EAHPGRQAYMRRVREVEVVQALEVARQMEPVQSDVLSDGRQMLGEDECEQVVLGAEPGVGLGLVHPRAGGDAVDASPGEPVLGKLDGRGLQETLPRCPAVPGWSRRTHATNVATI